MTINEFIFFSNRGNPETITKLSSILIGFMLNYMYMLYKNKLNETISCLICRLSLPGNIVENGHEKAEYNSDKGLLTPVVLHPKLRFSFFGICKCFHPLSLFEKEDILFCTGWLDGCLVFFFRFINRLISRTSVVS